MKNPGDYFSVQDMDVKVRPQDDFYYHVNGNWLRTYQIPPERAVDGVFWQLHENSIANCKEICEDALQGVLARPEASPYSTQQWEANCQWISAVYREYQDEEKKNRLGITPIADLLALIDELEDYAQLPELLVTLGESGVSDWLGMMVMADPDDPDLMVPHFTQGGLGLPDESFYRQEEFAPICQAYQAYLAKLFVLSDFSEDQAQVAAKQVFDFETKLAAHHWDNVKCRDTQATNNPYRLSEIAGELKYFDLLSYTKALGLPVTQSQERVIVQMPSFLTGADQLLGKTELPVIKNWLRMRTIGSFAGYLSEEFQLAAFDFYGRILSGLEEREELWKRAVSVVEDLIGEGVGQAYVARHFPPTHREKMEQLTERLLDAYREAITGLEWMGNETRQRALKKLDAFVYKIGYPTKSLQLLEIPTPSGENLAELVRENHRFQQRRVLAQTYGPVDRDQWYMTPQTVNAYYNPTANEIVFPAAILQPPFFNPDAPEAINFGAIGAVIGHEIGHGFDDQGSTYDGRGQLRDWWTDQDRSEFKARTQALIAQYDAYTPTELADEEVHVNGAFTIGENIGDLGGLSIAYLAWTRGAEGKAALAALAQESSVADRAATSAREKPLNDPDNDETTAQSIVAQIDLNQAFFYSWAKVWKVAIRPETARKRLVVDPHSPTEFRCNGVLKNMDAFHKVFNTKPGDGLWLDPEKRVRIWY